jgi:hypothetical protein
MASTGHAATPNSECGSAPDKSATSTDPSNLKAQMVGAGDNSNSDKVVQTTPGC